MNQLLKSILITTAVASTFSLAACQKSEEATQQASSETKPASQVDDTVVVTASEVKVQK